MVNSSPNLLVSRHLRQTPGCLVVLAALLWHFQAKVLAAAGGYLITQLAITNAAHPCINNHGEVVWAAQNGTGIYSSVRGQLSASGVSPHLANSGEVVYADSFGDLGMDLVSTTRGRLTFGGIIQLGFSDFNLNASGEVVYVAPDTNNNQQVHSTIRGQITFDPVDHYTHSTPPSCQCQSGESSDLARNSIPPRLATSFR